MRISSLLHHCTKVRCEVQQGDWAVLDNVQFIEHLNHKCTQRTLFYIYITSAIWVALSRCVGFFVSSLKGGGIFLRDRKGTGM